MAKRGSPEWRRRVSEGTRRGRKPWLDGLNVVPAHVRAFLQRGQVAASLRPMVADATTLVGAYAEELGGWAQLTAGQRVHLKSLYRVTVALDALFSRVLREGRVEALLEGVGPLLSAERAAVAALGLERAERPVPRLADYLAERAAEAPATDAETTPEIAEDRARAQRSPDPDAGPGDERPATPTRESVEEDRT